MAYYFAVETAKDDILALNARKTGFGGVSKQDNIYKFTLEEVDAYTTRFRNKKHFISFLLGQGIINADQSEKNILIVHSTNESKGCRKIPGEFIFSEYKDFLNNPILVIEYILNRANQYDYEFFKGLASFIPSTKENKNIKDQFTCISDIMLSELETGNKQGILQRFNSNGDTPVLENIKRYLLSNHKINKRMEVNYENLHILVSFISSYDAKLSKTKEANTNNSRARKPATGTNI